MSTIRGLLAVGFLVSIFTAPSSNAVPEGHFGIVYDLLSSGEGSFYKRANFKSTDGIRISYTKFGKKKGKNGSLIILPGRTESSLKYIEVAYDLIQRGFSPIYAMDHRGQGFSQRLLEDSHKGHVDDFSHYLSDVDQFIKIVRKDSAFQPKRAFLLAHSMGGSILMDYLSQNKSGFKAAALIAPMFRIASDKSEGQILSETFLACYVLGSCNDYIPDGGPFRWQNRRFADNDVTHSHTRFTMRDHLWRTWPELQLGDPTVRWVREAVQNNIRQRKLDHLSRIGLPMHIYQAENEVVVEKSAQNEVCQKIGSNCRLYIVKGAKHEILMETDRIRNAALKHIESFFLKAR